MVFSSLLFLFVFFPVVVLLYTIAPQKGKNALLLVASLLFYAWGEPIYIGLMLFSALADYGHGRFVDRYRDRQPFRAKLGVVSSIIVNLAVLLFFKYADFLLLTSNELFRTSFEPIELPLPIGLSFYTFQTMSYVIDIYRGQVRAERNLFTMMLYVCLFPQLIAGPIVRYEQIARELQERTVTFAGFYSGLSLFAVGLAKKVLLANNIGWLWAQIEQQPVDDLSVMLAWLGIAAFGFQLYFDFSGYSDMARGLGRMFGFTFPENFRYPFTAKSATEFWRRWHITLGNWFRDYVYVPLGGNRRGKVRWYRNILIVWALTGLWHGASWNFVVWGLYFGVILMIEKAVVLKCLGRVPAAIGHLYAFLVVMTSWTLFVFPDIRESVTYLQVMYGFAGAPLVDRAFLYLLNGHAVLLALAFLSMLPLRAWIASHIPASSRRVAEMLQPLVMLLLLVGSVMYLADAAFNPFLYFRF